MVYGIEDENLWQAATGFGGGIGGSQDVCGAVSGAVLAANIAMGRLGGDPGKIRTRTYKVVKDAYARFVKEFGGPDCRTLTGFDFSEPGSYDRFHESAVRAEQCPRFVRFMVETLAVMEQERQNREASKGS